MSARTVEDMRGCVDLFDSVCGQLKYERIDPLPGFLRSLPTVLGLADLGDQSRTKDEILKGGARNLIHKARAFLS